MKKETRVEEALRLQKEGLKIKEIAEKMQIKEWAVRGYLWIGQNPEKYKKLLKRYRAKKKKAKKALQPQTTQTE